MYCCSPPNLPQCSSYLLISMGTVPVQLLDCVQLCQLVVSTLVAMLLFDDYLNKPTKAVFKIL